MAAVEAGDGHPGPWGRLHQTVGLQAFQRLAHRCSADPQPCGDLGLAQTVAGTQSASDVVNSPIARTIIEQCASQIFFGSDRASRKDLVDEAQLVQFDV